SGQYLSTTGRLRRVSAATISAQFAVKANLRTGEGEYNAARAKGYAEGTADRITGKKDNIVGAVTGDSSQQAAGQARHDKGETQQEINKRA
ncbi:hypothetical protein K525DRAFT_145306, partial [Schizophyllum commune Loenen D]